MFRLTVSLIALIACATADAQPTSVPATFNTVYVPSGFDSNDNVQIVGEGMFRNTCYRPAPTWVGVDHAKREVRVGPVAYEYSGLCLQLILPFDRVLDVGILQPGKYDVVQATDGQKLGEIPVRKATSLMPDDHLYAPINQAFFRQKGLSGEVMLSGEFLTDCMVLEEVKVTVEPRVIVLQPIARIIERNGCLRGRFPFNRLVNIDLLASGRYLLHVRSMNAKAVNTLVQVN